MQKIIDGRGAPLVIRCDNGTGFISQALDEFPSQKMGIADIPPGQQWRIGSLNHSTTQSRMNAKT
jgi:hypothetical protein